MLQSCVLLWVAELAGALIRCHLFKNYLLKQDEDIFLRHKLYGIHFSYKKLKHCKQRLVLNIFIIGEMANRISKNSNQSVVPTFRIKTN